MRSIRSLAAAMAVFAIPLLTVATGSASASAATDATGVAWHRLALLHGWQSGTNLNSSYGHPSWAVKNGVVYLSGSVDQPSGTNPEFTRLPVAARPASRLYITVYTVNGSAGELTIFPTGIVKAYSSPSSHAQGFTSLASVSFPAASMARHRLSLKYGWKSSQSAYDSGDPSYNVSHGVVYLSGSLHQASGTDQIFAFLPKAARPAHVMYLAMYTNAGTIGQLVIETDGALQAWGTGARAFTSLAGVSYPVAGTTTHKLALTTGWTPDTITAHVGVPAYSVVGGVVYLSGQMRQSMGSSDVFAILPRAARPTHTLYIKVWMTIFITGTLQIDHNGDISAYTIPEGVNTVSLATISYPRTS